MYLSDDAILMESKAARDRQMAQMSNERAEEVLNQAKAIIFAAWKEEGIATTEQLAGFYEVDVEAVQKAVQRNRDELSTDGLRVARGKSLREVVDILSISSSVPVLTIWTPRAALRLAMFLRDSDVARQVRTLLIDIAVRAVEEREPQRELELQVELQQLRNEYQRTGWEIVRATSPRMLAFIRGELPLERTEIQYVERQTGRPLGTTTNYRILPQLVDDVGLGRNSDEDRRRVKNILKARLGMDFETGEGLGEGFMIARPLVIPEDRYEECLYVVAVELYGEEQLVGWEYAQQLLPDYLSQRGLLPSSDNIK